MVLGWGLGSLRAWWNWLRVEGLLWGVVTALLVVSACCSPPALPLTRVPSLFLTAEVPSPQGHGAGSLHPDRLPDRGDGCQELHHHLPGTGGPQRYERDPQLCALGLGTCKSPPHVRACLGGPSGVLGKLGGGSVGSHGFSVLAHWEFRGLMGALGSRVARGAQGGMSGHSLGLNGVSVGAQAGLGVAQWGFSCGSGTSGQGQ